jgi:serine/threonine protein kinase
MEVVEGETSSSRLGGGPLTEPGTILGTLAYMAPEQLRGQPADARSDIWAMGVPRFQAILRHMKFPD